MVTAGILLISTGVGAMGGYYLRSRKDHYKALETIDVKAIEHTPKTPKKIEE